MEINSFNVREKCVPVTDITQIVSTRYEVKQLTDESGIVHTQVVKDTHDDFLDVPFRDYSMSIFVATGEVNRLHFISAKQDSSLDMYDRISGDFSELSAKVDHIELMESIKDSTSKDNVSE